MVYAGNVYQAQEDAVAALVEATEGMANVAVDFLCPPTRVVPAGRTRWLPRADAQAALAAADHRGLLTEPGDLEHVMEIDGAARELARTLLTRHQLP